MGRNEKERNREMLMKILLISAFCYGAAIPNNVLRFEHTSKKIPSDQNEVTIRLMDDKSDDNKNANKPEIIEKVIENQPTVIEKIKPNPFGKDIIKDYESADGKMQIHEEQHFYNSVGNGNFGEMPNLFGGFDDSFKKIQADM